MPVQGCGNQQCGNSDYQSKFGSPKLAQNQSQIADCHNVIFTIYTVDE